MVDTSAVVHCLAEVRAKPEHLDKVKSELLKLVEPTRSEDGCLSYHLQQDKAEPTLFYFVESWRSAADVEAHMATAHLKGAFAALDGCTEAVIIRQLERISA